MEDIDKLCKKLIKLWFKEHNAELYVSNSTHGEILTNKIEKWIIKHYPEEWKKIYDFETV